MSSTWWVLLAFLLGGMGGALAMALMCMMGGLPKRSTNDTESGRFDF